jgi:2-polyprenyl-6-methoxyphenol hydroxylase-like FAD-dependent oxidoreductase
MSIEPPSTIAIVGAGPSGLEAALYARYLGYRVVVLEQAEVGAHVLRHGDTVLAHPFQYCHSTLAVAALRAQQPQYQPPPDDARLTAAQWAHDYLLPLAATDLVADHIRAPVRVTAITPATPSATSLSPEQEEPERSLPFTVWAEAEQGQQIQLEADVVIDASGSGGRPLGGSRSPASPTEQQPAGEMPGGDDQGRGDWQLLDAFPVEICPTTGGLQAVVRWFDQPGGAASDTPPWPRLLQAGAPHLYALGSKPFGRYPGYRFAWGLDQIRSLLSVIGGRADLDLYATW